MKMIKPLVLIAEDDQDFTYLIKVALKEMTIDTEIDWRFFNNGEDLLNFITGTKEHIYFIITDISMPMKNGIEVLKAIKGNTRTKHLPVFLFTSWLIPEDIDLSIKFGCNGYYTKGNSVDEFKDALGDMLESAKLLSRVNA
jgi:CheY-like chemotaxis protein